MAQAQLSDILPVQAAQSTSQSVSNVRDVLERYPVVFTGTILLKNKAANIKMHFLSGSVDIARESLPQFNVLPPSIKISLRMRLDNIQLEGVVRKMQHVKEHCILLAVPFGKDDNDLIQQSNCLSYFINYFSCKNAAGIVNSGAVEGQELSFVLYFFPACDFSDVNLDRVAPSLLPIVREMSYLFVVIAQA